MSKKILGIGNAIVDVFVRVDDNFLSENKLVKGSMKLIEKNEFDSLKNSIKIEKIEAGGSVANTMAGISYENAFATLLNQKKNRELAQHIYEVAQKKYQQGIGSNIEILNAEATLKESETNYYNAVFDALVAKIDYLKATGNLVK
jgi:hypothetical protein